MQFSEDLKNSKILIIDDHAITRRIIRKIFENKGFTNITEAFNGKDGWEKTLTLVPDIVLLDINMPVMNGLEYCIMARKNPTFERMAILVQTGLTDIENKHNIFSSGATDYITKPIDANEIFIRSLVHLKNYHYLKELEDFNSRIKTELQSARKLVDIALPNDLLIKEITKNNGIDIFSYFQSSSEMGGDFWGAHRIDGNKISIYVIDFSGHGVDSSLNAMRLDCLIKSSLSLISDPAKLMEWLNNNLHNLLPREQYATMFYGVIDKENSTLTYATAACPEMLILRNSTKPETLSGKGYPLGAVTGAQYSNKTIPFAKGDILMLYSDALIETEGKNGEFLSDITKSFLNSHEGSETILARKCFDSFIYNFMEEYGDNLRDDLTVVLLENI